MNRARLLVMAGDVSNVRVLADAAFSGIGYELTEASSLEETLGRMKEENFDVVIADLAMLEHCGLDGIREAKRERPETVFLVLSGASGIFLAVGESETLTSRDLCELEEVAEACSMTATD